MDYEQDYIMRLIKQMIQALASVIFNKRLDEEELSVSIDSEDAKETVDLLALADGGQINEAENLLWEHLDTSDLSKLRTALAFYEHINEYTNEFLEEHGYSREEVLDGIRNVAAEFGVSGLVDALLG